MNILLDLPFDETPNSPVAYDYSPYVAIAKVTGATFVPGKNGYAIEYKGQDYSKVRVPDLSGDFTALFWFKTKVLPPYDAPQSIAFRFAFSDNSNMDIAVPCILNTWQYITLVKDSVGAKAYIDGVLVGTLTFTSGNPTQWAISQMSTGSGFPYTLPLTFGANGSPYAMGDMDSLLIYDAALTADEINNLMNPPPRRVFYWIDGVPFLDFDCYVSESDGVIDLLEMKAPTQVDWANEHGLIVDLKRPRFVERKMQLSCFMPGSGMLNFEMKADNFLKQFVTPGLHRLKIEIDDHKPLVYQVYCPAGVAIDKKWRDKDMIGTFKIQLTDTQPIRRVLRFTPTMGDETIKINLISDDVFNFYWGDGQQTLDVYPEGNGQLVTHTYPVGKTYEIIIAGGEINNITSFAHNAILIWNRL